MEVEMSTAKNIKKNIKCPFKIGDRVKFSPSDHCKGWHQESFDRLRIHPGYAGIITKIEKDIYLYLDDGRGGFPWIEFKKSKK